MARACSWHARQGSSPLARGLRTLMPVRAARVWIIPARAGFTIIHPLGRFIPEDHPRSRGVYPVDEEEPS